jgi:RNA polymerase sigma factor (sigma-70 family)
MSERTETEERIDIDAFINSLPTKKRLIANLCREGMNQIEIAKATNLTKGRISQIISEFRKDIEAYL